MRCTAPSSPVAHASQPKEWHFGETYAKSSYAAKRNIVKTNIAKKKKY
jgi:hypothetical protein